MSATRLSGSDLQSHQLLTVNDVADKLQISARTVRRLIQSGELKAIRIGRAVRVHPAAFEAYMTGAAGK